MRKLFLVSLLVVLVSLLLLGCRSVPTSTPTVPTSTPTPRPTNTLAPVSTATLAVTTTLVPTYAVVATQTVTPNQIVSMRPEGLVRIEYAPETHVCPGRSTQLLTMYGLPKMDGGFTISGAKHQAPPEYPVHITTSTGGLGAGYYLPIDVQADEQAKPGTYGWLQGIDFDQAWWVAQQEYETHLIWLVVVVDDNCPK